MHNHKQKENKYDGLHVLGNSTFSFDYNCSWDSNRKYQHTWIKSSKVNSHSWDLCNKSLNLCALSTNARICKVIHKHIVSINEEKIIAEYTKNSIQNNFFRIKYISLLYNKRGHPHSFLVYLVLTRLGFIIGYL